MNTVMRRGGLALLALSLLAPGWSAPASAASPHRALVIVDTGGGTIQRVVTFDSESITGLRALELAGANPSVYSFAGQGGAVCKLFGVGRDAGPSCLGGADGDNRYWAYFRAGAGSSAFQYSRAGAGSTTVRDGDVEGWRWGTGQAPAWSPVPAPPAPPVTAAPPVTSPRPAPTAGPRAAPNLAGGAPEVAPTTGAPSAEDLLKLAAAMDAAQAASTTTTTTVAPDAEVQGRSAQRPAAREMAEGPVPGEDQGGGASPLVGLVVLLVALAGGGVFLRRRRQRPIP